VNQRRHLAIIAAIATLLAAAPIKSLYTQWTWAIDSFIAVAAVCATAIAARALRAPSWAQPLITLVALLLIVTWLFPSGNEFGRLIPSADTFTNFRALIDSAADDMRNLGIPVYDRKGLLFLTTAGIGLVAVVVDFVAVTLRRPAVAGLPMLAVYAVPVAISSDAISFVAFAVGAIGYLWLLATDSVDRVRMFGRRFTGDGRGVDMWEPSPLAAIGRRTAVIGVLAAVILPVAVPGLTHSLVGPIGPPIANGGGLGNCFGCSGTSVNLFAALSGQINSEKPVTLATVRTDAAHPPYLRFATADQLGNKGFAATTPQGQQVSQGLPNLPFTDNAGQPINPDPTALHTANIKMSGFDSRFLPVFMAPRSGTLQLNNDSWRYDSGQQIIFSPTSTAQNLSYTFQFDQQEFSPTELAKAERLPDANPLQRDETLVPSHPKLVQQIVDSATKSTSNEYETVRALVAYFYNNHFTYALSTKAGTSSSDIVNFLTNKQGYCVQYAAALAWLVREAHYPARVAFGFTNGVQIQPNVYQMTNKNLHAWTEVYFQGYGWVPFDATPPAQITGSVHPQWDPNLAAPSTGGSQQPGDDVIPTISGSASGGLGARPEPSFNGPGGVGGGGGGSDSGLLMWTIIGAAVVLALLLTPAMARVLTRNRRAVADRRVSADSAAPGEPFVVVDSDSTSATTRGRVHAAWDEFIDTLVDYQIHVDPTETPRAAATRIAETLDLGPEAADGARLLGMAEERARYARRPGVSQPLHEAVRAIRRALGRRVSFRTRFRAEFLPPSVINRWSAATSNRLGRIVAGVSAIRDSVLRAVNLRRLFRRRATTS